MQAKTRVRYHRTPTRVAKMKTRKVVSVVRVGRKKPSYNLKNWRHIAKAHPVAQRFYTYVEPTGMRKHR